MITAPRFDGDEGNNRFRPGEEEKRCDQIGRQQKADPGVPGERHRHEGDGKLQQGKAPTSYIVG
jgi:hypothetical protein